MNQVQVSIIIPVYNAKEYLAKCIEGVLYQTYSDFELILINDGSTDGSESILKEFCARDSRVQYYNQVNSGPSSARNYGLTKATGEFVCFIDADDYIPSEYLEKLMELAIKNDVVTCGYIEISPYGRVALNDFYRSSHSLTTDEFVEGVLRGVGGTLWGKVYRRSIIMEHQLQLNPQVYMCEDLLFNLDYAQYASHFGAIEECLYEYNRLNEGSITSKVTLPYLENNHVVIEKMRDLLGRLGWTQEKIDVILSNRMISLTLSIASNESANVNKVGLKKCCAQLDALLMDANVRQYFTNYEPMRGVLDRGGYYLKHRQLRRAVVSFYVTLQLRRIKLWIKKRSRV